MPQPQLQDVAARLSWARGVAGLSAQGLSRKAGLNKTHVAYIENRTRQAIDLGTARALAGVLGVSWVWLLAGEGERPTEAQIKRASQGAA